MGEGRRTGVTGRLLHHHTEGGERGNDLGAATGRSQGSLFVFSSDPNLIISPSSLYCA